MRAFRVARDDHRRRRWGDIEALDGVVEAAVQSELLSGVDWLVETTSRWYLVQGAGQRDDAVEQSRASFADRQIGPEA